MSPVSPLAPAVPPGSGRSEGAAAEPHLSVRAHPNLALLYGGTQVVTGAKEPPGERRDARAQGVW